MKLTVDTTALQALKANVQKNIIKKALRAGTKDVKQALQNLVPVETGALKQSITTKVDNKKGSLTVYGIVGASTKFRKGKRKPSRYAHLVEKKHHPLARAWAGQGKAYINTVQAVIGREIKQQAGN